jgi:hypothetical protein
MKNVITVFIDDTSYGKSALANAEKLAQIFDLDINTVKLNKKTDLRSVFAIADEGNTLCFVMPVAAKKKLTFFNVRKAREWIRRSRVPVFAIGNYEVTENDYQQIILPLDIHCQEKELALWATYFPEYFNKNCPQISKDKILIHILFNEYRDLFLRNKVQNNIEFVKKMFANLEIHYELHPFTRVNNIHTFGLQFAKEIGNSVLLYLMPEHNSLIDLLFGPVANKLLGNKDQIPVFCLNAREDIFVLCQ